MSLKRDDRFRMRPAPCAIQCTRWLEHPLGDAATLLSSGTAGAATSGTLIASERATKLVGSQTQQGGPSSIASEAQTLVAGELTNVREPVMAASVPARANRTTWAAAAILIVLVAGCAAAFYAYRARKQSPQTVAPTAPAELQPLQSSQPAN